MLLLNAYTSLSGRHELLLRYSEICTYPLWHVCSVLSSTPPLLSVCVQCVSSAHCGAPYATPQVALLYAWKHTSCAFSVLLVLLFSVEMVRTLFLLSCSYLLWVHGHGAPVREDLRSWS